jgi:HEAT repeat protein
MKLSVLAVLAACALVVCVVLYLILRNGSSSSGSGHPIQVKESLQVAVSEGARESQTGRSHAIHPANPNRELVPEMLADDAGMPTDQIDLNAIRDSDTTALCRRLGGKVRSGESQETIAISEELVRKGDGSVAELRTLLNSGNTSVETAAMRILVKIGTAESMSTAITKILTEPFGDSRNNLLKVFGNVRNSAVSGIIVDMIAPEKRPEGLKNLKEILSVMEGPEVIEALANRITEETDQAVLAKYLDVLAGMSKPSNTTALEEFLAGDKREAVQVAVASALAKIGDSKACAILASNGVTNVYCEKALEDVSSPYAQQTLMDMASGQMDRNVRSAVIKALVHYKTSEVRACLQRIQEKEQDEMILDAIRLTLAGIDSGTPDTQSKPGQP